MYICIEIFVFVFELKFESTDDGEGVMVAESVGKSTLYGQLATELTLCADDRASPLQFKLSVLADQISKIGYIMAICIAVSFLFKQIVMDNHYKWTEIVKYAIHSIFFHILILLIL
jgi:magnesium-transporting ATPase (P-type)